MTAKVKHCPRCSNALEPATLGRVSAGDAPLKLNMLGFPVLKCAKGHASPVHRDFMVWLMRELREKCVPRVPGGEAKGMLFKKYYCACGKELPSKAEGTASFPFELAFEGASVFKAEIEAQVAKCPGCGKEQALSAKDLAGATPQAVAALNDAAGFPHSG
jgi:hypothetical protein